MNLLQKKMAEAVKGEDMEEAEADATVEVVDEEEIRVED
jgi:hypothetical protein